MNGIILVGGMILVTIIAYLAVLGLGGWVARHASDDDEGWG